MRTEKIAVISACIAIVIGIGSSAGPIRDTIAGISESEVQPVWAPQPSGAREPLRQRIERAAAELRIAPVDARLDRVWKAIPGYNGLEVDVEATYRDALAQGLQEPAEYIYKELPAKTTLADLGAQPIYRGNPAKPMVSLMINVAWGNEYLKPMLDTLDREGVKTTFFLDGSWLKKNPELAEEIRKRGHELGNHAYSHPRMSVLGADRASAEITKTQELLKAMGAESPWFAPPSGDYDQETVDIAYRHGLRTVLWTLDTVDWRNPAPEAVVSKIVSQAEPGFLVLMHPTSASSRALEAMIRGIRNKGLLIGTVSQTLSPERVNAGS